MRGNPGKELTADKEILNGKRNMLTLTILAHRAVVEAANRNNPECTDL
jgi:hypothetical protein